MVTALVPCAMQTASVPSFVRQHAVVRTDTLQMLAVRHGIDVPTLKRVNNLMTDHSLHSRTHLFIPGGWLLPLCCQWGSALLTHVLLGRHQLHYKRQQQQQQRAASGHGRPG